MISLLTPGHWEKWWLEQIYEPGWLLFCSVPLNNTWYNLDWVGVGWGKGGFEDEHMYVETKKNCASPSLETVVEMQGRIQTN